MSQSIMRRTLVVAAILSFVSSLGVAPQASARADSARALARAIDVQEAYTETLMARPGVVGTAVGYDRQGRLAVKVFVVAEANAAGVPQRLNGMPVVVEVSGEIVARRDLREAPSAVETEVEVDPTARFPRPVPIGVSTGHPMISAGTIGSRVKDSAGKVYALSNNHVYANENQASLGDAVLQPGIFDGGARPRDTIGTLRRFVRLAFCDPAPFCPGNTMDAAIALSSPSLLGRATPADGYGTPRSTIASPSLGLRVMKYGRTTAHTYGRISAINATVDVLYTKERARFVKQMLIRPGSFSTGGDSGSLIVVAGGADARQAVGLLFAGSASLTVANPIGPVLRRLQVTIDGP